MPDFGDLFAGLPPLAGVILAAPILLVRMLRRHPLGRSSPPAPHIRDLEPRRV
jgi:hypothetical protein